MTKKLKNIPKFKSDEQEIDFWDKVNTSEYFDLDKGEKVVFSNLKPSTETISIRLPQYLLAQIKELANANDVPYQSFMKIILFERVKQEKQLQKCEKTALETGKIK